MQSIPTIPLGSLPLFYIRHPSLCAPSLPLITTLPQPQLCIRHIMRTPCAPVSAGLLDPPKPRNTTETPQHILLATATSSTPPLLSSSPPPQPFFPALIAPAPPPAASFPTRAAPSPARTGALPLLPRRPGA